MSSKPTHAVRPGMPRTPSAVEMGATAGSTAIKPRPSDSAYSRQPSQFVTHEPSGTRSLRDATTWPTAPPLITSPTWNGGRYDLTSFIRGRIDGSTDMYALRINTSPSAGSGTSTSTRAKSVGCGTPLGRAARWISRLVAMAQILEAWCGLEVYLGRFCTKERVRRGRREGWLP